MSVLQAVGILVGIGLIALAVLFVLSACQVAHDADELAERIWQRMKDGQE